MTYFNTSSNKAILQLMNLLKDYETADHKVKVIWHYKAEDEEMREEAEDFMLDTGLTIHILDDL